MQDLSDGRKFKLSSKDTLFSNLLEARNFSQENVMALEKDQADERGEDMEQTEDQSYGIAI
jgi:predicted house-cleaning noncanonical NTP pyrophosphatase (MazG superfamily)